MNEIIKALFIQAGGTVEEENGNLWTYSDDLDPEKFAQLIVQKCAGKVDFILREKSNGGGTMGDEIREHFGVEDSNLHTCPYAAEIHGDYETMCDCDEEQTYKCAMDI